MADLAVLGNNLEIKNPNKVKGMVDLAIAVALLLVFFANLSHTLEVGRAALQLLLNGYRLEQYIAFLVVTGLNFLAMIFCIINALRKLYQGLQNITRFFIPPGIPSSIPDEEELALLLRDRVISTFERPSSTFERATKLFSPRLRYLTRIPAQHVQETLSSSRTWLFWIIILVIPCFFSDELSRQLRIPIHYSFPYLMVIVGIAATAIRFITTYSLTSNVPEASVYEKRAQLIGSGNPTNFFNFILTKFDRMRVGSFQNRIYLEEPPLNHTLQKGETGTFEGQVMMETQPVPLESQMRGPGIILALGGGVLLVMGYAIVLNQLSTAVGFPSRIRNPWILINFIDPLLSLFAGIIAISIGHVFLERANSLLNLFRWQSTVVHLELQGSYTTSKIGLGDGRGGQLHSSRVSIQSDTHLTLRATRLLCETMGLQGQRVIISATITQEFQENIEQLLDDMLQFKDSSGKLAAIDIHDQNLSEITGANMQITQGMAAAQESGRISGYRRAQQEEQLGWDGRAPEEPLMLNDSSRDEDSPPATDDQVKRRLQQIKELLEEGLITEEEYQRLRSKILAKI